MTGFFKTNNLIISVTFSATAGNGGPFMPSSNPPAAQAAGAATLDLNTSFLLLPKIPMVKRIYDPRVGYFSNKTTVFIENSQKVAPFHIYKSGGMNQRRRSGKLQKWDIGGT